MVIDFHVHCFPDELAPKAVPALAAKAGIPPRVDGTVGDLRRSMKKNGVDVSVLQHIATRPAQTEKVNNWAAEIQSSDIVSFGSVHPAFEGWREELDRVKQLGLKGIKLHPDYQEFFVDDPGVMPFYEKAFELGLIILFHAGVDIGLPEPYHCSPERLRNVLRAFPGGVVVAAHMGGFGMWDDVERNLVGEDVYLDTSYSIGFISEQQFVRIVRQHGYRKILFATDSPWRDQGEEVRKIYELGFETEMEQGILGENARKLLQI